MASGFSVISFAFYAFSEGGVIPHEASRSTGFFACLYQRTVFQAVLATLPGGQVEILYWSELTCGRDRKNYPCSQTLN